MVRDVHSTERSDLGAAGALLGTILALVVVVVLVPTGGAVAGLWHAGTWAWPGGGRLLPTMGQLVLHARAPGAAYPVTLRDSVPGATGFWVTIAALEILFVMVVTFVAVAAISRHGEYGMLTRARLKKSMRGGQAALTSSIGTYLGVKFRPRSNDAVIVIAPQQSGKTTRAAAGRVKDAPGACVGTTTKVDLVDLTMFTRFNPDDPDDDRQVDLFDPDDISGWVSCQWDIVAGCEDPKEAETRAEAMIAASPQTSSKGGGGNIAFFAGQATTILKCLLHAAAVDGKTMRDVMGWAHDFSNQQPYTVLLSNERAVATWHTELHNATGNDAPETVASTSMTLAGALKSLSNPAVMALVCPGAGNGFNVQEFLARQKDTLYVLCEGGGEVSTAPLVTAFLASIERAGRRMSQHRPGGRFTPNLTFVLDEVANVAPLPRLGTMLSDGGGRGMQTFAFLQSFGQGRDRWGRDGWEGMWGRDGWEGMWGSTTLKLILPGCTETTDLENVSNLAGSRRVKESGSLLNSNERPTYRLERIMPPDAIQQLDDGTALMIYKNVGNAVINLPGWWERPDKEQFAASMERSELETGRAKPATQKSGKLASTVGRFVGSGSR